MSGGMREKDSSDYDLERLTELFDDALTSDDPRVKNALRQLMMMVILTSGDHEDQDKVRGRQGPMRRMAEDIRDLHRSVESLRQELHQFQKQAAWGGGYRTADNTSGYASAISAQDYWAQQKILGQLNQIDPIDPKSLDAQISDDELRGLNIAIAPSTKGLFK